jgi:hypothetical protein
MANMTALDAVSLITVFSGLLGLGMTATAVIAQLAHCRRDVSACGYLALGFYGVFTAGLFVLLHLVRS